MNGTQYPVPRDKFTTKFQREQHQEQTIYCIRNSVKNVERLKFCQVSRGLSELKVIGS